MNKGLGYLSDPITYEGDSIWDKILNGMTHFRSVFLNKDVKPTLYGKRIYFNMDCRFKERYKLPLPERYLHLVSLNDTDKFTVQPCINDSESQFLCPTLCENESEIHCFQIIERWECPYRLSRIHWIPEIIKLANEENSYVTYWEKKAVDNSKPYTKHFLRYTYLLTDYIIIFRSDDGNDLVFVSAYPVCSKKAKLDFNKDYEKHVQKTKEPEI